MKRLLSFGMIAAIVSLAIVSCKDDFNEEDFLRLQSELKLKQDSLDRKRDQAFMDDFSEASVQEFIAATNEAGDLLAVTLVVRENGVPVPGVAVSITSSTPNEISSGRTKAIQTGITDAVGNVVFDRVTIGSGTITFRKTGYVGSTATIDFGQPAAPTALQISVPTQTGTTTVTKYVPPVKRFEEAFIPMYSAIPSAGSTATITGRVIIENNVTNTGQEVPTGVVIRANLVGLVTLTANTFISNFVFEDNSSLGVATVAANGTYSMTVPATAAGLSIPLIIPNIEGTSRMAVNAYDNGTGSAVSIAGGPEYRDVPTSWGPQAPLAFGSAIPQVAGAKIVFPAAPAAGSGLAFDFSRVAKGISSGTILSSQVQSVGGNFYRINSRGNYAAGSNPVVTITGGGGTGATALATMRTYLSSLSVLSVGSGYFFPSNVSINLVRVRQNDVEVVESSIAVPVTATGTLPATIDLAAFSAVAGFNADNQKALNTDLKSLKITVTGIAGTGAQVSGTFETEIAAVDILAMGSGYTTAPAFAFAGGGLADGSAEHAVIQVVDFPVNWTITPNNSNTVDYSVMPNFTINYPNTPLGALSSETDVQSWSQSGDSEGSSSLLSRLTISSGDVIKKEPGVVLRTVSQSGAQPTIVVTPILPVSARRSILSTNISTTDGSIAGSSAVGAVIGVGYNTPVTATVQPAVTGAPGSGAVVSITNFFNALTLEYQQTGLPIFLNPGSGYLSNLNQKGFEAASFPSPIVAQPGKTYNADINYGTGTRKVNVN